MKALTHLYLIVCCILINYEYSHAQLFDKLAKKLEEKVNKTLNLPANSPKNTPVQNTSAPQAQTDNNGAGKILGNILGKIGGGNIDFNVKPQASYAFQMYGINKTTMISVKEKMPQVTLTKTMFHLDQLTIGITILDEKEVEQSDKGILILDPKLMAFFSFLTDKNGKKTYFGMHIKEQPTKPEPTTNKPSASAQKQKSLIKTGKTKTIMGIKCDGYAENGEKGEVTTYWLAPQTSVAGLAEYNKAMERYGKSAPNMGSKATTTTTDDELAAYIKQGQVQLGHDILQKNGDLMMSELYKVKAVAPSTFSTAGYASGL